MTSLRTFAWEATVNMQKAKFTNYTNSYKLTKIATMIIFRSGDHNLGKRGIYISKKMGVSVKLQHFSFPNFVFRMNQEHHAYV